MAREKKAKELKDKKEQQAKEAKEKREQEIKSRQEAQARAIASAAAAASTSPASGPSGGAAAVASVGVRPATAAGGPATGVPVGGAVAANGALAARGGAAAPARPAVPAVAQSPATSARGAGAVAEAPLRDMAALRAGAGRTIVYVMGLSPRIAKEEILRRHEYFGQYGKILRIQVSARHPILMAVSLRQYVVRPCLDMPVLCSTGGGCTRDAVQWPSLVALLYHVREQGGGRAGGARGG